MQWTLKKLLTNDDGTVDTLGSSTQVLKDGITVLETVGDEMYLECGDLVVKQNGALTHSIGGTHEWYVLYIDDILVDVFEFDIDAYEYDAKRGFYTYRFKSIQKIFFENLTDLAIIYSSTATEYNSGITDCGAEVDSLSVLDGDAAAHAAVEQWTFSLGDILDGLEGKHNSFGFVIDTVTHPCAVISSATIPVLWRGRGVPLTLSEAAAINETFYALTRYAFDIRNFIFTVSGISVEPAVGDTYSNNSSTFEIIAKDLTGGAGTLTGVRISGTNNPAASGNLARVSGSGDNPIAFSAYAFGTENVTDPINYAAEYTNNSSTFQIIGTETGKVIARRVDGSNTPNASGYLTYSSGTGDTKIGYYQYATAGYAVTYGSTWMDIFNIVTGVYNSFIAIKPKIVAGTPNTLKIDIIITPKIDTAVGSTITVDWIECKLVKKRYEINGVAIDALNYTWTLGATEGHIFSKSVPVAENMKANANDETDLYIGITEAGSTYDWTSPSDVFFNAVGGDVFIEGYYENQINLGDGYEGTILPLHTSGTVMVKLLNQVQFDTDKVIQLTKIEIGSDFLCQIEGVRLYI